MEDAQPNKQPTGKRYPVCRLVLHQEAAIDAAAEALSALRR